MSTDPELTFDEASGFYVERIEYSYAKDGVFYIAFPDQRVNFNLHHGRCAHGDTPGQAIAFLQAGPSWKLAA